MRYNAFGKTGYNISAVAYGGIVSAARYDSTVMPGDGQAASDEYVRFAIERGVNYFDVAPSYGDAEDRLGPSLQPYRKQVWLACKTGQRRRAEAEAEMRRSLQRLRTDYFDSYQLHALSTMEDLDIAFGPGGVMELMRDMREQGLARKIGFTAHTEAVALKALSMYDFDTVLFPYNWHMNMAHGMGSALIEACRAKGVGALCMKSMIDRKWDPGERETSKYPKSWCKPLDADADGEVLIAAMKYALSLGVDTLIPPGNFDHFRFAVEHIDEAVDHPLTDDDKALLAARLETVKDRPFFGPESYAL